MNYTLTIGWLYPELMSTYGDRGNITALKKRCEWRGIEAKILHIDQQITSDELSTIDLLFGGGAQDHEQEIVMPDLKKKGTALKELIENNIPALFVCGAPQLMGNYYEPAVGKRIEGLGIFDMVSKHPGIHKPRLIGNVVAEVQWSNFLPSPHPSPLKGEGVKDFPSPFKGEGQDEGKKERGFSPLQENKIIVGFENHGGRTYLGENAKPFAKVLKGNGNNGEDGTEGVVYKNAIGCYFHGPLLPKNPQIADFLIQKALEVKYKEKIALAPLDDSVELKAKTAIANRLGIAL